MPDGYKIFTGTANPHLANLICNHLEIPLGRVGIKKFADNEMYVQYQENIRGCDVFIIQPTSAPVNDNLMELVFLANAARLASANSVTMVLPYYGYARQDRKDKPRVPISAQVVAGILQSVRPARILTVDLHSAPIQGYFPNLPVDHLYALPIIVEYLKTTNLHNTIIVTPDLGGITRARALANHLSVDLAVVDKNRKAANESDVMNIIGDIAGKNCILVDDLIDTAGTLVKGAEALLKAGALSVRAAATHGVLSITNSSNAIRRIEDSCLTEVIVTNTINQVPRGKIKVLDVSPLMAKAISAIYNNGSISGLFI